MSRCTPAGIFNHRQPLAAAHLVGQLPHTVILALITVVFLAVPQTHRLKNKMVVQRSRVKMGCNQHLISVAPHLLRKLNAEPVTLLRRNLSGFEALVRVVSHIATGFAKPFLHGKHLGKCRFRIAINARHGVKLLVFIKRFVLVRRVSDDPRKIMRPCLFGIACILYHIGKAALNLPYLRHRHLHSPLFRDKCPKEFPAPFQADPCTFPCRRNRKAAFALCR